MTKNESQSLPQKGPERIYQKLRELNISFGYLEHPPAPTAELAAMHWEGLEGGFCKNILFRNHKGRKHYLLIVQHDNKLAVRDVEARLKQGKLTFASEWRLEKYLGVKPGSISPLGLVFDDTHNVHVFLDEELKEYEKLFFHPNENTAAIIMTPHDLIRYIESCGNTWEFSNLKDSAV